jgi:hypothetical protein
MSITQTVEIPASRRLTIDVPREVPLGKNILTFTPAPKPESNPQTIEEVRQLLQKEIAQNGTAAVPVASGDGWEANVRERYAE